MPEQEMTPGLGAIIALLIFIVASVGLGVLAQRAVRRGEFLKGYFLGHRSLGSWALALTATVQSGGTFMGFPSLVYSHGWVVALWIAGYMVCPMAAFGVIGKRTAQLSRRTNAITVPDLFRERFASPAAGLTSSLLIMFLMGSMMVAQFKAGALIMKIAWPETGLSGFSDELTGGVDAEYYIGLGLFAATVVGYTLVGGFLAAVWTDLFQSILMLLGVLLLLALALPAAGGLEQATRRAVAATGPGFAFGPGYAADGRQFLPLTLAFSYFLIWPFANFASPAGVLRMMACRDTVTIRRSVVLLSVYNFLIYLPLVAICVCARAVMPGLRVTDEVIPRMAMLTTRGLWGGSLWAGLILAAPFGAVMSTVSSYLVLIASGLVRDVYQRFLRPGASEQEVRWLSYVLMACVGVVAVAANIRPVAYLQAIVVFSGTSAAATFLVPLIMAAYWRRATAVGILAAMLAGAGTMLSLFAAGWCLGWQGYDPMIGQATRFRPYFLFGFEPIIWGLCASLIAGVTVSLCTRPPDPALIRRLFDSA